MRFFEKREDAIICLAEYNAKPYDIKAKKITFEQLYKNWVNDHFDSITNSTRNCYKTAKKYCQQIDNIKFADLRTLHLQRVIDNCPKYSIRKNIRILLNMLYKYAEKQDIADKRYSQYKNYIWNPIMQELGLDKKPHECKHTCATKLKNAGIDELIRKRILGHATQDITDRYTHINKTSC